MADRRTAARSRVLGIVVLVVLSLLTLLAAPVRADEKAGDRSGKDAKKRTTETSAVVDAAAVDTARLEQLRVKAVRIADQLTEQTAQLEASQAALAAAVQQRDDLTAQALAAQTVAARAHDDLGRYAAAAYRGQQVSLDITVLMAPQAETSDTLHALATLIHTGGVKGDIATFADDSAKAAVSLEAQAAAAATAAEAADQVVQARLAALETRAAQTHDDLVAEVSRLERVALRKLSRDCRERAALAGRYPNGLIPPAVLCEIGIGGHRLRGDAAAAFRELAVAYEKDRGDSICITDSYRSLDGQYAVFESRPHLAAVPGTSQHGLGLAVDLCGGIETFGSKQHLWMIENAPAYGWFHPDWAQAGGSRPEAWHWEYDDARYLEGAKARAEERRAAAKAKKAEKKAAKSGDRSGGGGAARD